MLLLAVIAAGSFLRLVGLGHESLWNDELSSWYRSSFPSIRQVVDLGVKPDVHPPGYQVLLFCSMRVTGDSETALRLPSAIAGILTIPVLFLIGRKLFGASTGLLGSALLAVSPSHIWLSQEARPYALLILLVCLSVLLLIRLLARVQKGERASPAEFSAFVLLGILLEYTHYFGLLVFLLEAAALLGLSLILRRGRLLAAGAGLAPMVFFLPWLPVALAQSSSGSYIALPTLKTFYSLVLQYMGWSKVLTVILLLMVPAGLVMRYFFSRARDWLHTRELLVPILWLAAPVLVSLAISLVSVPVFSVRNMMVSLPAVFLLMAVSTHVVFPAPRSRLIVSFAVILLFLFTLFFVRKHYSEPHRHQFREVVEYLVELEMDPCNTVIAASAWNEAYFNYYLDRAGTGERVDLLSTGPGDIQRISGLVGSRDTGFLVLVWGLLEPEQPLIDSLGNLYTLIDRQEFIGAGLRVYNTPPLKTGSSLLTDPCHVKAREARECISAGRYLD